MTAGILPVFRGSKFLSNAEVGQINKNLNIEYKQNNLEKYQIQRIGIFGSTAKNEIWETSDIDIVVQLKQQDLLHLIGIKQDLEESLKYRIDIVSYRNNMNAFLKDRIDKEAVYV